MGVKEKAVMQTDLAFAAIDSVVLDNFSEIDEMMMSQSSFDCTSMHAPYPARIRSDSLCV